MELDGWRSTLDPRTEKTKSKPVMVEIKTEQVTLEWT